MAARWQAGLELLAQSFATTIGFTVQHMRSHVQTDSVLVPALIITVASSDHQVRLENLIQVFATRTDIEVQIALSHVHSGSVLSPALIITSRSTHQSASHAAKSPVHTSTPPTATVQAATGSPLQLPRTVFSDFTAADNQATTIANGVVTRIPDRIRTIVANYATDTDDFQRWLLAEVSQFKILSNLHRIGTVQSFVAMTKIITDLRYTVPLRIPSYLLVSLRRIIQQRRAVWAWYQNMARARGAQAASVLAKSDNHAHFIRALNEVLRILEGYEVGV